MLALAALTTLSVMPAADAADWHGGGHAYRPYGFHGHQAGIAGSFDPAGRTRYTGRGRFWANRPNMNGPEAWRYGYGRRGGHHYGSGGYEYGYNGRWGHDHRGQPGRLLRQSSSSNVITNRGSGVTVILSDRPDVSVVSNDYAGAGIYRANGGTYATGFSDGYGDRAEASALRPRAKIIDTARAVDPCSHENGVCVIRGQ